MYNHVPAVHHVISDKAVKLTSLRLQSLLNMASFASSPLPALSMEAHCMHQPNVFMKTPGTSWMHWKFYPLDTPTMTCPGSIYIYKAGVLNKLSRS